ncbi:MAG: hypothetical protein D6696_06345 [Acidobacteria bacterium]|nr:MAG: hypothetical protein D6696_06345 [Acidobacteriota bacterium]
MSGYDLSSDERERIDRLQVSVRRMDGAHRVVAIGGGIEYLHRCAFEKGWRAWELVRKVREKLRNGGDLDLRHWETVEVA